MPGPLTAQPATLLFNPLRGSCLSIGNTLNLLRTCSVLTSIGALIGPSPAPAASLRRPVFQDVEPADRSLTERAYKVFVHHCPGLFDLSPLVQRIRVGDQSITLADGARARGWTIGVWIEVRFRDAELEKARETGVMLMNDYIFLVGSGNNPGILSMASSGLRVCTSDSDSDFLPAPEANFLKQWPSTVSDEQAHPGRKLDSTVVPFGDDTGH